MRNGKCKLRDFEMYFFRTIGGCYAELWFWKNTVFEFKEQENGNYLLIRKGMNLSIPKSDFDKLVII
ncbi:hypothetical protein GNF82_13585 [Clostridium perfringens]